jgi:hypothetical protein
VAIREEDQPQAADLDQTHTEEADDRNQAVDHQSDHTQTSTKAVPLTVMIVDLRTFNSIQYVINYL